MFKKHRYRLGTTKSLLYWQGEWFKRFLLTWFHILWRPAYWKWKSKSRTKLEKQLRFEDMLMDIDDPNRF